MAILIEEEKKQRGNILATVGWVIIVVILLIAGYYLFVAVPGPVLVAPSAGFTALQPLSQISVLPQDVANMSSFQALHQSASQPATSTVATGKPNPFIP